MKALVYQGAGEKALEDSTKAAPASPGGCDCQDCQDDNLRY